MRDVEVLPYDEAFAYVGLRLVKTQSKEPYDAGLSIEFENPSEALIQNVRNNSPAEDAGLQANDEIVSLAGKRVTHGSWLKTLARYRRRIKANMVLGQPERFDYKIEERADASAEQKALRVGWLSGK